VLLFHKSALFLRRVDGNCLPSQAQAHSDLPAVDWRTRTPSICFSRPGFTDRVALRPR
jgi:hypothetical protein